MELSHIGADGNAKMVNVGDKEVTKRMAVAEGAIYMKPETLTAITSGQTKKGNVLNTAKVAGIMAGKNTSGIIPMCHNVPLSGIDIDFEIGADNIVITAVAYCEGKTGVEMEALTAVSATALTIYDMAKAIDREMEIKNIRLLEKDGGKSGRFVRKK